MVTIRCNYLIDLPSRDARKLAKLCKRHEETHVCPVDWGKLPCLFHGLYCSEITANDWKKFLKDTKVVEEEMDGKDCQHYCHCLVDHRSGGMSMDTTPRYSVTTLDPGTVRDAIKEAYAQAALVQRLAAKPTLTPDEVSAVYGLSVPYLAKMRAENRGPEYVMLGTRKIVYTQKAIEKWMRVQTVTPRNV